MAGEQIYLADKQTLDDTKTQVDSVKVDTGSILINTNTIKSDVSTIKTYTDLIENNLGSNSDGVSATGSVHAKLKDIKANLGNGNIYSKLIAKSYSTNIGYDNTALLNITGKGMLKSITFGGSANDSYGIVVMIDGLNIINDTTINTIGFSNSDYYGQKVEFNMYFNESLIITGYIDSPNQWNSIAYDLF